MKSIILFVLMGALGCSLLSQHPGESSTRKPAQAYDDNPQSKKSVPPEQNLTFDKLKNIIVSSKISSIDETLSLLNHSFSEYLKFHILMYKSLSLHEASFEEPRAIVFGPEAQFVITFNGGVHQRGGASLETMEYSKSEQKFLFREMTFKGPKIKASETHLKSDDIEFENEKIVISKPNPSKCLKCHGANASPIWMTYFLWPGAYGSNDDHLYMSFIKESWNPNNLNFFTNANKPHSQGRNIIIKEGFRDTEVEGYIKYLEQKPMHPRYKWLPPHIVDQSYIKYKNGESFANLDLSGLAESDRIFNFFWPARPNLFYQELLMKLNQDRLLAKLNEKNLMKSFQSPVWQRLFEELEELKKTEEKDSIHAVANLIHKALSQFPLHQAQPSLQQVQESLLKNLKDEISMQLYKMDLHESNFTKGSLIQPDYIEGSQYNGYDIHTGFSPIPQISKSYRFGSDWLSDPIKFYTQLLSKKNLTESDKIAISLESDDQIMLTVLDFLLKDRGIDLRSYNMNFLGMSLSFHSGGLGRIREFLGVNYAL